MANRFPLCARVVLSSAPIELLNFNSCFPSCVIQAKTQTASNASWAHNALVGKNPKPFETPSACCTSFNGDNGDNGVTTFFIFVVTYQTIVLYGFSVLGDNGDNTFYKKDKKYIENKKI